MKKLIITSTVAVLVSLAGCESLLDENVYSELTPEALNTLEGTNALLYSAYSSASLLPASNGGVAYYFTDAMPSGEAWNEGGNIEASLRPLTNFAWDSNLDFFAEMWRVPYAAIRDANLLIEGLPSSSLPDETKAQILAEARFIRAFSYALLYGWFGPVPLVTPETASDYYLPRATGEEVRAFIEQELRDAADQLPLIQADYGRATKGAALGVLTKFYLNTRQWEKTVAIAREIIALNHYQLLPTYAEVFSLSNEGNRELLWVLTRTAQGGAQFINALTFPTDYPLLPNQGVYAARTYLYDDFVLSFEDTDTRRNHIVKEYTNTSGQHIALLGNDRSLSLKYEFDPEASGPGMGNDIPVVRYADILLSLAEALNELDGPTEEAIGLVNQIHDRANQRQAEPLRLTDFDQASLRVRIYREREWEFYTEAKRREDQIRLGTFIEKAVNERGKNADAHHVLFPIPQTEISANPNLVQNEGY